MAYNIFISYSTKDLNHVNHIKSALSSVPDVSTFVAEYTLNPGQSLSADIINAIGNCDLFILLWSDQARNSEWVPMEIGIAKGKSKPILPIILHSNLVLPGFIKDLKYLDINNKNEDPISWLRNHIFTNAQKKKQNENLVLLGLGGILLWALTSNN